MCEYLSYLHMTSQKIVYRWRKVLAPKRGTSARQREARPHPASAVKQQCPSRVGALAPASLPHRRRVGCNHFPISGERVDDGEAAIADGNPVVVRRERVAGHDVSAANDAVDRRMPNDLEQAPSAVHDPFGLLIRKALRPQPQGRPVVPHLGVAEGVDVGDGRFGVARIARMRGGELARNPRMAEQRVVDKPNEAQAPNLRRMGRDAQSSA